MCFKTDNDTSAFARSTRKYHKPIFNFNFFQLERLMTLAFHVKLTTFRGDPVVRTSESCKLSFSSLHERMEIRLKRKGSIQEGGGSKLRVLQCTEKYLFSKVVSLL